MDKDGQRDGQRDGKRSRYNMGTEMEFEINMYSGRETIKIESECEGDMDREK